MSATAGLSRCCIIMYALVQYHCRSFCLSYVNLLSVYFAVYSVTDSCLPGYEGNPLIPGDYCRPRDGSPSPRGPPFEFIVLDNVNQLFIRLAVFMLTFNFVLVFVYILLNNNYQLIKSVIVVVLDFINLIFKLMLIFVVSLLC